MKVFQLQATEAMYSKINFKQCFYKLGWVPGKGICGCDGLIPDRGQGESENCENLGREEGRRRKALER